MDSVQSEASNSFLLQFVWRHSKPNCSRRYLPLGSIHVPVTILFLVLAYFIQPSPTEQLSKSFVLQSECGNIHNYTKSKETVLVDNYYQKRKTVLYLLSIVGRQCKECNATSMLLQTLHIVSTPLNNKKQTTKVNKHDFNNTFFLRMGSTTRIISRTLGPQHPYPFG